MATFGMGYWLIGMGWPMAFSHPISAAALVTLLFILVIVLFLIGAGLAYFAGQLADKTPLVEAASG